MNTSQTIGVAFIVGTLMWKFIGSPLMTTAINSLPFDESITKRNPLYSPFFQTWTFSLCVGAVVAGIMYYDIKA